MEEADFFAIDELREVGEGKGRELADGASLKSRGV